MFTMSGERTKWLCTVGSGDKGHDKWVCAGSARREREATYILLLGQMGFEWALGILTDVSFLRGLPLKHLLTGPPLLIDFKTVLSLKCVVHL